MSFFGNQRWRRRRRARRRRVRRRRVRRRAERHERVRLAHLATAVLEVELERRARALDEVVGAQIDAVGRAARRAQLKRHLRRRVRRAGCARQSRVRRGHCPRSALVLRKNRTPPSLAWAAVW